MAKEEGIKVIYLHHSGFAVALKDFLLVFDHVREPGKGGFAFPSGLLEGRQLVFFVSHKHPDHFQLSSLAWAYSLSGNARFFVGNDIKLNEKYLERKGVPTGILNHMSRMAGGAVYESPENGLKVEALRSTDQGVAFLVTAQGRCIYHAGDLNFWYWEEEPKEWNDRMEREYKAEIDKIAGRFVDAAFVPLDPRLKSGYGYGMDYFLQKVDAGMIFPMHMWEDYEVVKRYKQTENGKRFAGKIADVSEANREFYIL